jgi:taspase (threonine aspartase 1)
MENAVPASFVAVHVGAGYHSTAKDAGYQQTMRQAVAAARDALRRGGAASQAVVAAIRVLEVRSPATRRLLHLGG